MSNCSAKIGDKDKNRRDLFFGMTPYEVDYFILNLSSIVYIVESHIQVGKYANEKGAYIVKWDVFVIDFYNTPQKLDRGMGRTSFKKNLLTAYNSFQGGQPPPQIVSTGSGVGSPPVIELNNWLSSLPVR